MKNNQLILTFVVFGLFTFGGFWSGQKVGQGVQSLANRLHPAEASGRIKKSASSLPEQTAQYPIPRSQSPQVKPEITLPETYQKRSLRSEDSRQHNLLVVMVDDLDQETPQLNSAWLIIYADAYPHYMLMPIYPTSSNQYVSAPESDAILPRYFRLAADKRLDLGFVMALQEEGIWWTEEIIVDEPAVQTAVDFLLKKKGQPSNSNEYIVSMLPSVKDNPLEALLAQAHLAEEMCRLVTPTVLDEPRQFQQFIEEFSGITSANFDIIQAGTSWFERLGQGSGFTCEFPSMAAAILTP